MTDYVVVHMDFKNLPPRLGIVKQYNLIDKVWKQVTAEITYVHRRYSGSMVSLGVW